MLRFKINRILLTLFLAPRTLLCQMNDGVDSAPNNSRTFSPTGPNAAEHGEAQKYPIGTRETMGQPEYLVGSYSHFDTIFPAKSVPRPDKAWTFQRSPHEPDIHYYYHGEQFSLVMVQTAVRPKPISPEDAETVRLWLTLVKQLGGN